MQQRRREATKVSDLFAFMGEHFEIILGQRDLMVTCASPVTNRKHLFTGIKILGTQRHLCSEVENCYLEKSEENFIHRHIELHTLTPPVCF